MNTHKKYALMLALAGSALFAASASAQLAKPLYEFTFNDPANGTNTANGGSQGGNAAMSWYTSEADPTRVPRDLHSNDQLGVSGKAGDYAFNNSGASRMGGSGGGAGYGGMAQIVGGGAALQGATSFTIAGWYKSYNSNEGGTTSIPTGYARIIELGNGLGIWLDGTNANNTVLRLRMTTSGAAISNYDGKDAIFVTADTWTFFAFTFEQTTDSKAIIKVYGGNSATDVALIGSPYEIAAGGVSLASTGRDLTMGNSIGNNNQRPFQGYLDNFRVWGATGNNDGALGLEELQAIRAADLGNTPIPEPATTALLAGAGVAALVALRRRRRS